jgi:hypothetical protein
MAKKNDPDSEFWSALLNVVDQQAVIPVIGQDLIRFSDQENFYETLAKLVAKMSGFEKPERFSDINDVNHDRCKSKADSDLEIFVNQRVWPDLRTLYGLHPNPPSHIATLARLPQFSLFVTTTVDTYLERALRAQCKHAVTFLDPFNDKDAFQEKLERARMAQRKGAKQNEVFVAYLFGRFEPNVDLPIDPAILEAQMLEQTFGLIQDPAKSVLPLLSNLNLLFIGVTFPDWLARFLIRAARKEPLHKSRGVNEFVVNSTSSDELKTFLNFFTNRKCMLLKEAITSPQFIETLAGKLASLGKETQRPELPGAKVPVLVSYKHEDDDAHQQRVANFVERLKKDSEFVVLYDRDNYVFSGSMFSHFTQRDSNVVIVLSPKYAEMARKNPVIEHFAKKASGDGEEKLDSSSGIEVEFDGVIRDKQYRPEKKCAMISLRSEDDALLTQIIENRGWPKYPIHGDKDQKSYVELVDFLKKGVRLTS